jgi:hypothetical protein
MGGYMAEQDKEKTDLYKKVYQRAQEEIAAILAEENQTHQEKLQ